MFHKLLIANRGEIACRIARTARRLGLGVAAVYSEADAGARHVRLADEAWPLGPAAASESYLSVEAILHAALRSGADAIHPGYGFLSESTAFAEACGAAGIAYIGPSAAAIAAMGDKGAAKACARRAGVPVLPGTEGQEASIEALERRARALGFPLIVKPAGGGGGKGMQVVHDAAQLTAALEAARRVAVSAFGEERLLLERYLPAARHVEVQILADTQGHIVHLLDRDCSVQRRHQKLIEEAPAPDVPERLRTAMGEAACRVAGDVAYAGAGTVEFLLDGGSFYFIEMNTRLQVEHPVTEAVTGIDLVEWQIRIAAGEPLDFVQTDVAARGHAVEARVCGEDPTRDFLPASGVLRLADWPRARSGIRVDLGFETADVLSPHYDSLLGKLVAHAPTRAEAIDRLIGALGATRIAGVATNVEWLARVLGSSAFRSGPVDTGYLARFAATDQSSAHDGELARFAAAAWVLALRGPHAPRSPWERADGFRLGGAEPIEVRLSGDAGAFTLAVRVLDDSCVSVSMPGEADGRVVELVGPRGATLRALRCVAGGAPAHLCADRDEVDAWHAGSHARFRVEHPGRTAPRAGGSDGSLTAKLPGVVVAVHVSPGEAVQAGQELLAVEAMKMEHKLRAPREGVVAAVHVRVGDSVTEGRTLVTMAAPPTEDRA